VDSLSPVSALLTDTGGTEFENNLEDWNDDGEPEFDSIDPSIADLNLNGIRIRNSIDPDDDDDDLELSAQLPTSTGSSKAQVAGTITFDPRTNCVVLGGEKVLDVPIPEDSNMERLDDADDTDDVTSTSQTVNVKVEGNGDVHKEPATQIDLAETINDTRLHGAEPINYDPVEPNDVPVEDFHCALMVFFTACDLSLQQYVAFREVVALATLESIKSLPESLPTLKRRVRRNIPLMKLRGEDVSIELNKIPPKLLESASRVSLSLY